MHVVSLTLLSRFVIKPHQQLCVTLRILCLLVLVQHQLWSVTADFFCFGLFLFQLETCLFVFISFLRSPEKCIQPLCISDAPQRSVKAVEISSYPPNPYWLSLSVLTAGEITVIQNVLLNSRRTKQKGKSSILYSFSSCVYCTVYWLSVTKHIFAYIFKSFCYLQLGLV